MTQLHLSELAARLGGTLEGDGERIIRGVGSLPDATDQEVTFLANARYEKHMTEVKAAAVLVPSDYSGPVAEGVSLIRCKDAYFAFRQAMVLFHGFRQAEFDGVDPSARIDKSVSLASGVKVGANVVIARGCVIGEGSVIYPGAYLGPGCRLGRGCILYPNVVLYDGTLVGERVIIHANTSIGHDGFGHATHKGDDGVLRHEKIPQAGWVEIEDDVEIGACCTIDRATMGATVIGAGTKFSNLVAIGHGTRLGRHCLLVAQAGISGSVTVGNYCVFAGQCGVVGHIRIGDGVRIGAKAGVTNDVESGQEMLGSPAVPLVQARRAMVTGARLPEIHQQLRRLQKQVDELMKKLEGEGQAE